MKYAWHACMALTSVTMSLCATSEPQLATLKQQLIKCNYLTQGVSASDCGPDISISDTPKGLVIKVQKLLDPENKTQLHNTKGYGAKVLSIAYSITGPGRFLPSTLKNKNLEPLNFAHKIKVIVNAELPKAKVSTLKCYAIKLPVDTQGITHAYDSTKRRLKLFFPYIQTYSHLRGVPKKTVTVPQAKS